MRDRKEEKGRRKQQNERWRWYWGILLICIDIDLPACMLTLVENQTVWFGLLNCVPFTYQTKYCLGTDTL